MQHLGIACGPGAAGEDPNVAGGYPGSSDRGLHKPADIYRMPDFFTDNESEEIEHGTPEESRAAWEEMERSAQWRRDWFDRLIREQTE